MPLNSEIYCVKWWQKPGKFHNKINDFLTDTLNFNWTPFIAGDLNLTAILHIMVILRVYLLMSRKFNDFSNDIFNRYKNTKTHDSAKDIDQQI